MISHGARICEDYDGQMKASPDGKRVANSMSHFIIKGVDLFDFNNSTGELMNVKSFTSPGSTGLYNWHGIEFSSDATKLYGTVSQSGHYIYQFNVTLPTGEAITDSAKLVLNGNYNIFEYMQMGPDHKIYFTKGGGSSSGTEYLGVINYPNASAENCAAEELGLYLNGENTFVTTTPNFIQDYFYKPTDFNAYNTCLGDITQFTLVSPIPVDSVTWNFGDGGKSNQFNPVHSYAGPGMYMVKLIAFTTGLVDTTRHNVMINPLPEFDLGNDTTVCRGFKLDLSGNGFACIWSTGETTDVITPFWSGPYWVSVTDSHGCVQSDTVVLTVNPLPVFTLGNDTAVCSNFRLEPGHPECSYLWSDGSINDFLVPESSGIYWVKATNELGCSGYDTIQMVIHPTPTPDLGPDTTVCHGFLLDLRGHWYNCLWNTGSEYAFITPDTSGAYWVCATNEYNCSQSDTISLVVNPTPYFTLGTDTTICTNTRFFLAPKPSWFAGSVYQWMDGSSDSSLLVTKQGKVVLTITSGQECVFSDSILIIVNEAPSIDIGNDTVFECTSVISLDAGKYGSNTSYLWNDNSTKQYRMINGSELPAGPNMIYVTVQTPGNCYISDTLVITRSGLEDCRLPSAVLYPNPCDGTVFLDLPNVSDVTLKVFNYSGKLVKQQTLSGNDAYTIDLSSLSNGVYIIEYTFNEFHTNLQKVVIR